MPKKNRMTTTMSKIAIIRFSGVVIFNDFMKTCKFFFPMAVPMNVARAIMALIKRTMAKTKLVNIIFSPFPFLCCVACIF